jgi:hypothetical protein
MFSHFLLCVRGSLQYSKPFRTSGNVLHPRRKQKEEVPRMDDEYDMFRKEQFRAELFLKEQWRTQKTKLPLGKLHGKLWQLSCILGDRCHSYGTVVKKKVVAGGESTLFISTTSSQGPVKRVGFGIQKVTYLCNGEGWIG